MAPRREQRAGLWVQLDRAIAGEHPHATIFHPQWLSVRAQVLAARHAAPHAQGVLVDIGCGQKPFDQIFRTQVTTYVGIDHPLTVHPLNGSRADVLATIMQLPLRSQSVDTVLLTEVLEHLPEPVAALRELHRLLKPGGVLLLTAPMIYNLHGSPQDFFRFTPDGLSYLLAQAGFHPLELRPLGSLGTTLGTLMNNWLTVVLEKSLLLRVLRRTLLLPVLWVIFAGVNLCGWLMDMLIHEPRFAFNHLAIAQRTS
ncbi:MAG: class I SAM-dependent methyltransferase [Candidatus Omnitrophica bacterium]|nr:class I SAM-dependent methyltransferase [Candidatus Omnitrophota bacterium]